MKQTLILLALSGALAASTTQAQNGSGFYRPLTLAPVDATASSGGTGEDENDPAELAKKLQNPVASLISVPIQNNWDFGIGPADAMKYTANIQPVVPLSISKDWNLIIRTIMPVIYAEATVDDSAAPSRVSKDHYGLGDITQSFFFSPKAPVGGWILAAGPVAYWPTATDSVLGAGKWGAGPTALALRQQDGWTYGALANHIWSYAGWGDKNVSATFIQPFVSFTTKKYTTFGVNTESTYDWETDQWTVPLNFTVQQLVKIGKQPIAFQLGYRYYAEKPEHGPDWGLRFAVTFLFPKK